MAIEEKPIGVSTPINRNDMPQEIYRALIGCSINSANQAEERINHELG